jgi:ATP-binding cassette subfamily C protein
MRRDRSATARRATLRRALLARPRTLAAFAAWTAVGSVPALVSGWSIAHSVDRGFLAGNVLVGIAWLYPMLLAALVGAVAARRVSPLLGALVEPVRDELVGGVVSHEIGAAASAAGRVDRRGVAAVVGQTDGVRDLSARLLGDGASVVAVVIAAVVGLASLDGAAAVVVAGPPLLALAALAALAPTLARRGAAALQADERVAGVAAEVVASARDVRACGAEGAVSSRAGALIDARAATARSLARAISLRTVIGTVGAQLPLVALLALAPSLLRSGRLTAGGVIGAVTYLTASLQPALTTVIGLTTEAWLQLGVLLRRVDTRLAGAVAFDGDPLPVDGDPGDLVATDLCFSYGAAATPIVDGFDLTVRPGEYLAIVGPSGIGKSTVADLLAGLTPPDRGQVRFRGSLLDPRREDRPVALIPQEAYVFAGTLGENLRYLRPDAADEQLAQAMAAVGAGELARRLGCWDAAVDPRTLSAGERQLIALARTWLSPAPVVILDEATCHLDPRAEAVAERAFARRPGSLVVIAHRISSARRARRILLMDGDRTWSGTHAELLAASPLYRTLVDSWHVPAVAP